jgi:hypothetical protein
MTKNSILKKKSSLYMFFPVLACTVTVQTDSYMDYVCKQQHPYGFTRKQLVF